MAMRSAANVSSRAKSFTKVSSKDYSQSIEVSSDTESSDSSNRNMEDELCQSPSQGRKPNVLVAGLSPRKSNKLSSSIKSNNIPSPRRQSSKVSRADCEAALAEGKESSSKSSSRRETGEMSASITSKARRNKSNASTTSKSSKKKLSRSKSGTNLTLSPIKSPQKMTLVIKSPSKEGGGKVRRGSSGELAAVPGLDKSSEHSKKSKKGSKSSKKSRLTSADKLDKELGKSPRSKRRGVLSRSMSDLGSPKDERKPLQRSGSGYGKNLLAAPPLNNGDTEPISPRKIRPAPRKRNESFPNRSNSDRRLRGIPSTIVAQKDGTSDENNKDSGRKAPDRRKGLDRTRSGRDSMRDLMAMQRSESNRNLGNMVNQEEDKAKENKREEGESENASSSRSPRRTLSRSMSGRDSLRDLMALQRAASEKDLKLNDDDDGDETTAASSGASSSAPRPAPLQRRDNLKQTKCPSTRLLQETTKDSEGADQIVDESGDNGIDRRNKSQSPPPASSTNETVV